MASKQSDSFTMRPLAAADIDALSVWFRDMNDLALFDRSAPLPVGPEAVAKIWNKDLDSPSPRSSYWYVGVDNESDAIVGVCGIENINYIHGDGVVPMFVAKHARRKGVGMKMAARIIDMGFGSLRLRRLSTFYRIDNAPTATLINKLGFHREGVLRQAWFCNGRHIDVVMAGILMEDWLEHRNTLPLFADDEDETAAATALAL